MAPVLYLIRHGETDWNAAGRLQGRHDIPLNDRGRAQAREAAARLRRVAPDPAALDFVASPLARARETAEILRRELGLDPAGVRLDPRLQEVGFGLWEGLAWREIRRATPRAARDRDADRWGYRPPGGESYADAALRIVPLLGELERDTVLVSHGGTARVIVAHLCGYPEAEAPRLEMWQGRVLVVEAGDRRWA